MSIPMLRCEVSAINKLPIKNWVLDEGCGFEKVPAIVKLNGDGVGLADAPCKFCFRNSVSGTPFPELPISL